LDGLNATTVGNFTLACGSMNKNIAGSGWNVNANGGLITLKGVNGFGNALSNINTSTLPVVIIRTCVVPPLVIIKPTTKGDDSKNPIETPSVNHPPQPPRL
jgi:hypothetical protein